MNFPLKLTLDQGKDKSYSHGILALKRAPQVKNCGVGRTFKLIAERQRVWRNILMLNDSELMKRYIEDRAGKMFEVDLIRDLLTSLTT